jgi:glycogen(starch) synthase
MLAPEFPPRGSTAIAAHVHGLSRALVRGGHDVVVLTSAHEDAREDSDVDGVRVLRTDTDLPWLPDDFIVAHTAAANSHLMSSLARIGNWRPDVVHVHDWNYAWAGNTLSTLDGAPLVATIHSTERGRHGGHVPQGDPSAIHSVEWWLSWQAQRVICCSRFMMREVLEGFELTPDTVRLVPNGVDTAEWAPPQFGAEREPLVLAWGRVQYEKGFQVLAQAMARLRGRVPGISCLIAGRGPYLPELQSQLDIEGVGDLVQLAGYVPRDELKRLLHRAGCVVIPSLYEPFGVVALEALAADVPVVAADTGGLAEIMHGSGAALLFEPGNAARLAESIERVLVDRNFSASLRTKAGELLRDRYSWDAIAEQTLEVYRELD